MSGAKKLLLLFVFSIQIHTTLQAMELVKALVSLAWNHYVLQDNPEKASSFSKPDNYINDLLGQENLEKIQRAVPKESKVIRPRYSSGENKKAYLVENSLEDYVKEIAKQNTDSDILAKELSEQLIKQPNVQNIRLASKPNTQFQVHYDTQGINSISIYTKVDNADPARYPLVPVDIEHVHDDSFLVMAINAHIKIQKQNPTTWQQSRWQMDDDENPIAYKQPIEKESSTKYVKQKYTEALQAQKSQSSFGRLWRYLYRKNIYDNDVNFWTKRIQERNVIDYVQQKGLSYAESVNVLEVYKEKQIVNAYLAYYNHQEGKKQEQTAEFYNMIKFPKQSALEQLIESYKEKYGGVGISEEMLPKIMSTGRMNIDY
ncbi:MAG TPA: hypothetical protein VGW78_07090 [Candidatus Babeliales bacterium]|jgi:hypothetical protein|nr:hypothetical protein [Candidatus Babeliales bacterium]